METGVKDRLLCYHCGDECSSSDIVSEGRHFCCQGCKLVFELLRENNLCTYYTLNNRPGQKKNSPEPISKYAFLDMPDLSDSLITFKNRQSYYVTFQIPSVHCSSCIYLLENFNKINPSVISSRVDFLKKEISLVYDAAGTSLRSIVEQLDRLGYEPAIRLDSLDKSERKKHDRSRIYKIGVAGFCFGNIMMLSLPDYLSSGLIAEKGLKYFFNYLNLFLALPVFFYSANEFLGNAWKAIREKTANIDVPIALGIAAMFIRSMYEVLSHTGTGYFDSMAGLVFFMLIGRKFQAFTFESLAFDRNYKSYFPIAVSKIFKGKEHSVSVYDIAVNDKIRIRNNEVIPVDGLLLSGNAVIDYSFVTGESKPVAVKPGEAIYAGARQTGGIIEISVTKKMSQSRLTQLWNQRIENERPNTFKKFVTAISKWFIAVTILIAASSAAYWYQIDPARSANAFSTVLVIACACALALSAPFTFGNMLRIFGRHKIYLKGNETIEKLADIDTIVFDKTGTLTEAHSSGVEFQGVLTSYEKSLVLSLCNESTHPLSRKIVSALNNETIYKVENFRETTGQGLSGMVNGHAVCAGKASFTEAPEIKENASSVYVAIDNIPKGCFLINDALRPGLDSVINNLKKKGYSLAVLSGDTNTEEHYLRKLFGEKADILFNQLPGDKLEYIKRLQSEGKKVLMIGDGLNDAGALKQSDAGLSVSENINNFTPASDGIIDSSMLARIPYILDYSKSAIKIIVISFIISLLYNIVGVGYAARGILSPVIAAVLMPVSTISLVVFTVAASSVMAKVYSFTVQKG